MAWALAAAAAAFRLIDYGRYLFIYILNSDLYSYNYLNFEWKLVNFYQTSFL